MLILVNQTYRHKINTIKIDVKNLFDFGLNKFIPVVYIEYQLENNSEEITKNFYYIFVLDRIGMIRKRRLIKRL
jgi:hypothetical protein